MSEEQIWNGNLVFKSNEPLIVMIGLDRQARDPHRVVLSRDSGILQHLVVPPERLELFVQLISEAGSNVVIAFTARSWLPDTGRSRQGSRGGITPAGGGPRGQLDLGDDGSGLGDHARLVAQLARMAAMAAQRPHDVDPSR